LGDELLGTHAELYLGNCLEVMPALAAGSVDMVLADPPYGTTACAWDSVIPFSDMWAGIKHCTKKNAAIVLTASQPFTSALVMSNADRFKYCWYWIKNRPALAVHARNRPMGKVEDIAVFSDGSMGHASLIPDSTRMKYYPQGVLATGATKTVKSKGFHSSLTGSRPRQVGKTYEVFTGFPHNVLEVSKEEQHAHPTQKPVALMEYLIKTYTLPGETVLDFTMGSGTTGVACKRLGRNFIGIELDPGYFEIAKKRIESADLVAEESAHCPQTQAVSVSEHATEASPHGN
jgi:site-specific DNA-methyltransferase (adenine-specific)